MLKKGERSIPCATERPLQRPLLSEHGGRYSSFSPIFSYYFDSPLH